MRTLSLIGREAFEAVVSANVQPTVFDGRNVSLNRRSGSLQARYFARLFVHKERARETVMACTSLPHCDLFGGLRNSAGARLDRRRSDESFPRFKDRREGPRGRAYAVQAEVVRPDIQEPTIARTVYYTVKEGDTLTSIARNFKTTVQSIALTNQIVDVDYVPAGIILLVPTQSRGLNEASAKALDMEDPSFPKGLSEQVQFNITTQKGSVSLMGPMLTSSVSSHLNLVKVAASFVILFAITSFFKKYVLDFVETKINREVLRRQAEKEIQDVQRGPKLRRWQGILNEDREAEDLDAVLSADGQIPVESQMSNQKSEEEKLRETYAQLESTYAKFLADSGLSKSGYWRGGVPPASEED